MKDHRAEITRELITRLSSIRNQNGSATDIGRMIFVGEYQVQEKDPPCIILIPGDETPLSGSPFSTLDILYTIYAYVPNEGVSDYILIDEMMSDIRNNLWDCKTPFLSAQFIIYVSGRPVYASEGGRFVGCEMRYSIRSSEHGVAI